MLAADAASVAAGVSPAAKEASPGPESVPAWSASDATGSMPAQSTTESVAISALAHVDGSAGGALTPESRVLAQAVPEANTNTARTPSAFDVLVMDMVRPFRRFTQSNERRSQHSRNAQGMPSGPLAR